MAEKKVIELEIKTDSVGNLKSELRKAQAEVAALSEKFGATSQEAVNAAKKAAELKDAIGDAKALTDAFNPDAKFNALSASIGGVLNGFQAFEGALGLIGVESEGVQKALLQVQSAMALSQGVQGLMEAKDSFVQLKAVIGQTALGQKALAIGTNIASVAMKAFNVVLKANPIGLVITAITALVGAIAFFTRETGNAKEAAEQYTQALENQRRAIDDNFNALEKRQKERIDLMKAQGATEQQIFEQELKNTLKLAEAKAQAHVKEKYSYQNLRRLYKQLMDQGNEEEAAGVREQLKTSRERYLELQKQSKDYYHQISQDNKIFNAENVQKNKENADKVRENAIEVQKKQAEDRKAANEKRKQEEEQRLKEERERLEKQKEFILTEDIEEALRQQLVDSEAAKDEIRQEAIAKQEEEDLILMQFKGDLYKQDVDNFDEAETKKKQLREDNLKSGVQQAKLALDLIASIAESNAGEDESRQKKAFQLRKAANIASATIDGYKAVLSTYADTPGGPVVKGVAAAIAGAFALLQISNIAKSEFTPSGGNNSPSAPTPSGGTSSVITPNFNIVGNAQATNPLAGLGNQPLQAYVVSGEVTTAQSLDRNRINYATFG
jgi:hypothetical protein